MSTPPDYSRRRYLATLPTAVVAAGCAGELGSGNGTSVETPKLLGVGLQNLSFARRVATLEVEKSGSVVHSEEYTLKPGIDATDPNDDGTGNIAVGPGSEGVVSLDEPWMGDRVQYAVTADVSGVGSRVYTTEDHLDGRDEIQCRGYDIDFTITGDNLTATSTPMPPDCQSTDILP